ncbi:MAG: hypothetical protein N4J56_007755 [Chroococcidiopsis sp. SAG 2025]|uniref:hypothetical protein n=1 Tax=Chroococcidiopsis sp. SAG 2025 TaxID=171389 RepID=UPI002936E9FD|nr:hypothetical protein [Chroococcidiopsis sp. SAG 2025]MDV2998050.1 hypothetical protein [Chroococcidiopsis sp. SAG 2025]
MERSLRGQKTICIPIASVAAYGEIVEDRAQFQEYLDETIQLHRELFPPQIQDGYRFYGMSYSRKQNLKLRRVQLLSNREVYQLRPDFMMPYMIGQTDAVEKALYLRRYGVPYEALAYVFGRDAMYWYRAEQSLGKFSLVGTTVKVPEQMPVDLVADEKHSWLLGARVYLPTTVARECILGVDIVQTASTEDLTEGYRSFRDEALNLRLDYQPQTVNTDGWQEMQTAWKQLFPRITIVLCFLHSILGIQQHLRRSCNLLRVIQDQLWQLYQSTTKRQFAQRLRRLLEWATPLQVPSNLVREKLHKLKAKAPQFQIAYAFADAHRTSNALDRLMNHQDRYLYSMQYFHGTFESAHLQLRAMALLWNFHPYSQRTQSANPNRSSPFGELNGFVYHHNWLHNLLIAGSMNGYVPRREILNKIH